MKDFSTQERESEVEGQIRHQFSQEEEIKLLRRTVAFLLKTVTQILPETHLRELEIHPELSQFWGWHNTVEDILRATPEQMDTEEDEAVEAIHNEIAQTLAQNKGK